MSRVFTNTTGQRLTYTGSMGITARPLTLLAWIKFTSIAGTKMLAYNNVSGSYIDLELQSTKFYTEMQQASGGNASTTGSPSTATWYPVIMIYDGSGNVNIYALGESVTGGFAGTFNAESSPNFCIGGDSRQGAISDIDGKIAHVAMWSSALSSGDRTSLIAGATPSTISSGTLTAYWPLTDTSLVDTVSGKTLSITGTVNSDSADNPTVGAAGIIISQLERNTRGEFRGQY